MTFPTQVCDCPPGWTNDFVGFFHTYNCDLPESFLTIFFAIVTCTSFFAVVAVGYKARGAKKHIKLLRDLVLLKTFVDWVHVLCVYLQGGMYEAGLISLLVISAIGFGLGAQTVVTMLTPIARSFPRFPMRTLRRGVFGGWFLFHFLFLVLIIYAVVVVRDPRKATFNTLIFVSLALEAFYVCTMNGFQAYVISKFQQSLDESASNLASTAAVSQERVDSLLKIRDQIQEAKKSGIFFAFVDGVMFIPILAVFLIYGGYFPYFWVFWMLMFSMFSLTAPFHIKFLETENGKQHSTSHPNGSSTQVANSPYVRTASELQPANSSDHTDRAQSPSSVGQ